MVAHTVAQARYWPQAPGYLRRATKEQRTTRNMCRRCERTPGMPPKTVKDGTTVSGPRIVPGRIRQQSFSIHRLPCRAFAWHASRAEAYVTAVARKGGGRTIIAPLPMWMNDPIDPAVISPVEAHARTLQGCDCAPAEASALLPDGADAVAEGRQHLTQSRHLPL